MSSSEEELSHSFPSTPSEFPSLIASFKVLSLRRTEFTSDSSNCGFDFAHSNPDFCGPPTASDRPTSSALSQFSGGRKSTEAGVRSVTRFCHIFLGSSTGWWAVLQLLCCQARNKSQEELLKKNKQNLSDRPNAGCCIDMYSATRDICSNIDSHQRITVGVLVKQYSMHMFLSHTSSLQSTNLIQHVFSGSNEVIGPKRSLV